MLHLLFYFSFSFSWSNSLILEATIDKGRARNWRNKERCRI